MKSPFVLRELKIEVTYSCPLVCIHCSSDAAPNIVAEIEENKCLDIIEQAIKLNIHEIAFSGGEPLNYKPLLNCVKKCSDGNLISTIYTTGNNDSFSSLIKDLKMVGLNKAVFSLYSSRKEIHERITRIANSYNRTIEAIQIAMSIGLKSEIHFVALKTNLHDLPSVVELAKSLGIKRISVLRFVPQGRGSINSNELLEKGDYIYLKNEIERIRKNNFDIRTGSPFNFLLLNKSAPCKSAIDKLIINPYLDIFPCDAFKKMSAKELVGSNDYSNLSKYSLEDCWNKSPFLNEVRQYLKSDFPDTCRDCNLLERCFSGCLAQKVLKQRNFKKSSDPDCIKLN
jgi:radical SAM protein with 4Fe4S-binding SPASM domain